MSPADDDDVQALLSQVPCQTGGAEGAPQMAAEVDEVFVSEASLLDQIRLKVVQRYVRVPLSDLKWDKRMQMGQTRVIDDAIVNDLQAKLRADHLTTFICVCLVEDPLGIPLLMVLTNVRAPPVSS